MKYDLGLLHSNSVSDIKIDGNFDIPKNYYEGSMIFDLKGVKAKGIITRIDDNADRIKLECSGSMLIEDSISLEKIWYPFKFFIDDSLSEVYTNYENNENILDIFELLWENIVLEVPLNYSEVKDFGKYKGNGWSLKDEDEAKNNDNPFSDILKDFGKE